MIVDFVSFCNLNNGCKMAQNLFENDSGIWNSRERSIVHRDFSKYLILLKTVTYKFCKSILLIFSLFNIFLAIVIPF